MTPPEQTFEDLCRLLTSVTTVEELMTQMPVLTAAIPELAPMIGFDQHSPHHAYDVFTHTAHVVAQVPPEVSLRWAALLHDVGKVPTFTQDATGRGHFYGHARKSAEMADTILRRLQAPEDLRERVVFLIDKHMTKLEPDKDQLRSWLSQLGKETVEQLLALQEADMCSKSPVRPAGWEYFLRIRGLLAQLREEDKRN